MSRGSTNGDIKKPWTPSAPSVGESNTGRLSPRVQGEGRCRSPELILICPYGEWSPLWATMVHLNVRAKVERLRYIVLVCTIREVFLTSLCLTFDFFLNPRKQHQYHIVLVPLISLFYNTLVENCINFMMLLLHK